MNTSLPYHFSEPPARLKKARLDNIALVPASLLSLKGQYQSVANKLPVGSVLCVQTASPRQRRILESVVSFFRKHGHQGITLPIERISQSVQKPRPKTENVQLAF